MTSDFLKISKLDIFWKFFSTVNSTNFNIKENSPFFQYRKIKGKKTPLLLTVYSGLGKIFSPTRSFYCITSIQMQMNI
jgi:hypothetical protein